MIFRHSLAGAQPRLIVPLVTLSLTERLRFFPSTTLRTGAALRMTGGRVYKPVIWWKDQSGQSLVEFALMFVSFMFVMAGIFDFSRAIFYYNSLSEAARIGARYAIVHGENASSAAGPCASGASCDCDDSEGGAPNASAIRTAVLTRTIGMNPSTVTTTCSWPDQNVSGTYLNSINKRVTVTVSYTYQPILTAFIPEANITLLGQVTSFIQY